MGKIKGIDPENVLVKKYAHLLPIAAKLKAAESPDVSSEESDSEEDENEEGKESEEKESGSEEKSGSEEIEDEEEEEGEESEGSESEKTRAPTPSDAEKNKGNSGTIPVNPLEGKTYPTHKH